MQTLHMLNNLFYAFAQHATRTLAEHEWSCTFNELNITTSSRRRPMLFDQWTLRSPGSFDAALTQTHTQRQTQTRCTMWNTFRARSVRESDWKFRAERAHNNKGRKRTSSQSSSQPSPVRLLLRFVSLFTPHWNDGFMIVLTSIQFNNPANRPQWFYEHLSCGCNDVRQWLSCFDCRHAINISDDRLDAMRHQVLVFMCDNASYCLIAPFVFVRSACVFVCLLASD